jgi:hypothetical protein
VQPVASRYTDCAIPAQCKWEDNIKMDLTDIGWGGMDYIHVTRYRKEWRALVDTAMNLRVP